jgi:hypothetical protein
VRTLVVLDVPTANALPESLLGCSRNAVLVAAERVRGLVAHASEVLAHLDEERDLAPDLIVVSTDPAPTAEADTRRWGLGWRVGRDLSTSWAAVAVEEGRVAGATWCEVGADGIRLTRSTGGDDGTGLQLELGRFFAAASTDVFVVRRDGSPAPRLRDQEPPITDRLIRLWHGSPVQGLERLTPPEGGRLWVSSSSAFAVSFGASPYSNHGFFHGVDRIAEEIPQVYFAAPPDREGVLDRPCSLYSAEVEVAELRQEGVRGFEFFLRREVPVVSEQRFATVAEALATFGLAPIRLGSAKVEDTLAQRCRPHRHALEGWLGLPLDIALRIPAFVWRIRLWFVARGLDSLDEGDLPWLGRIVERAWLPWVAARWAGGSTLPEQGYHSLAHLLEVALLGAWLALREGVNPIPVALFGLLHDAARTDDELGSAHAEAAVVLFDLMQESDIRYLLLPRDAERVRAAIARHANGERSQDPLIGVCWDADRVRLAWERGVVPRFFSTYSGLELAYAGPDNREGCR